MDDTRRDRLGSIGEYVVAVFPRLQREVTVPHEHLIHVTHAEAVVLRVVVLDPGATVTQIAKAIGQHRSNTSMRIANLEERGLVEKRSEPGDGREVRVHPTQRARDNLSGFHAVWGGVLDEVSSASEEELEIAARVLGEMAERLGTWKAHAVDADG